MASQFTSVSESNPFFEPDIWIGTGLEQHVINKSIDFLPNADLTVENDEIKIILVNVKMGKQFQSMILLGMTS